MTTLTNLIKDLITLTEIIVLGLVVIWGVLAIIGAAVGLFFWAKEKINHE